MAAAFVPIGIAILTVSDTRTPETDSSGDLVQQRLEEPGHRIAARTITPDDAATVTAQLRAWIDDPAVDAIVATGGTGITARDVTPEALAPLVTKAIPGFGELFRWLSYADIGSSTIQSRADAALCDDTLVFILPGSTGACRLAMDKIIVPQLDARQRPCNFVELLPRIRGG